MSSVGAFLLGVVNVAIVVVILLLVGALALWLLSAVAHITIPGQVQQLYLVLVALIGLYMLVALIFGLPTITVLPFRG